MILYRFQESGVINSAIVETRTVWCFRVWSAWASDGFRSQVLELRVLDYRFGLGGWGLDSGLQGLRSSAWGDGALRWTQDFGTHSVLGA